MKNQGIVDRIEGGFLILEKDGEYIDLPLELFPEDIKEGDLVEELDGGYIILEEETRKRKEEIESLFDSIFSDDI